MPSRGLIDLHTASWLFSIQASMSYVAIKECMWLYSPFKDVATARNDLVGQILVQMEKHPDWECWVLWVDDDMAPSALSMNKLFIDMIAHPERTIESGWFSRKDDGDPGIVFSLKDRTQLIPHRDYNIGEAVEVEWLGLAFTLMRGEFLRKIPQPWFKCDPDNPLAGEDRWFCQQAKKAGARFFVNTGVPIGHASVKDQKVFWPYAGAREAQYLKVQEPAVDITPPVPTETVETAAPDSNYVSGFINCDNKELFDSMLTQMQGSPYIMVVDNGRHLKEELDPAVGQIIGIDQNVGWGPAFNYLMGYVAANMPHIKAVWVCNDDIKGATPEVAKTLYETMCSVPGAAVVCPSLTKESSCSHKQMYQQEAGMIRQENYVDFCAPMVSVAAWNVVGGLNTERYGPGHGLDLDWCARAKTHGYRMFVDDSVAITHDNPGTTCMAQGTVKVHCDNGWQRAIIEDYGNTWDELCKPLTVKQ